MKTKNVIFLIIILVLLDQIVKLIIANYFIDANFDIIESVFGFHPIYNDKYSYANAMLGLEMGVIPHTILLIIIQLLLLLLYGYYKTVQVSIKLIDLSFIFGQAALICVFCGFFFWNKGILDFIFVYPFTFDFKDIYLNCFVVLFLLNSFKYKNEIEDSNLKIRDYMRILFNRNTL